MKYCPYCGVSLNDDMAFCPKCGKQYQDGSSNIGEEPERRQAENYPAKEKDAPTVVDSGKKGITRPVPVILSLIILVLLIIGGIYYAINSGAKRNIPESNAGFIGDSTRIDAAAQSVVMVYSYDKNGNLLATGSGFVAYDDSTIVTNNHVTDEAFSIKISTEQDHTFEIESVLTYDTVKDIILLKTKTPTGLTPLELGTSNEMLKGESVLAIGSPEGLKNTVSTGVLSGRVYDSASGMDVLQISAPISHGSSGGALFDDSGKVIGITFAGYEEGQNLNFAIPVEGLQALHSSGLSSISVMDYISQANPAYKFLTDYSDIYVDTTELFEYPDRYNEKTICTIVYIYRDGRDYYAYEAENTAGLENDKYDFYKIDCDMLCDKESIEALKLSSGEGTYAIVRGHFWYYPTFDLSNYVPQFERYFSMLHATMHIWDFVEI